MAENFEELVKKLGSAVKRSTADRVADVLPVQMVDSKGKVIKTEKGARPAKTEKEEEKRAKKTDALLTGILKEIKPGGSFARMGKVTGAPKSKKGITKGGAFQVAMGREISERGFYKGTVAAYAKLVPGLTKLLGIKPLAGTGGGMAGGAQGPGLSPPGTQTGKGMALWHLAAKKSTKPRALAAIAVQMVDLKGKVITEKKGAAVAEEKREAKARAKKTNILLAAILKAIKAKGGKKGKGDGDGDGDGDGLFDTLAKGWIGLRMLKFLRPVLGLLGGGGALRLLGRGAAVLGAGAVGANINRMAQTNATVRPAATPAPKPRFFQRLSDLKQTQFRATPPPAARGMGSIFARGAATYATPPPAARGMGSIFTRSKATFATPPPAARGIGSTFARSKATFATPPTVKTIVPPGDVRRAFMRTQVPATVKPIVPRVGPGRMFQAPDTSRPTVRPFATKLMGGTPMRPGLGGMATQGNWSQRMAQWAATRATALGTAFPKIGKTIKLLGRLVPGLAPALGMYMTYSILMSDASPKKKIAAIVGVIGGSMMAWMGAGAGALLGTAIFPGAGTIAGAIIGGAVGWFGGAHVAELLARWMMGDKITLDDFMPDVLPSLESMMGPESVTRGPEATAAWLAFTQTSAYKSAQTSGSASAMGTGSMFGALGGATLGGDILKAKMKGLNRLRAKIDLTEMEQLQYNSLRSMAHIYGTKPAEDFLKNLLDQPDRAPGTGKTIKVFGPAPGPNLGQVVNDQRTQQIINRGIQRDMGGGQGDQGITSSNIVSTNVSSPTTNFISNGIAARRPVFLQAAGVSL